MQLLQYQPPQSFPATLDGIYYNVLINTKNAYGDRLYLTIQDQNGSIVLYTPIIASTKDRLISMTAGYFNTGIYYISADGLIGIDDV